MKTYKLLKPLPGYEVGEEITITNTKLINAVLSEGMLEIMINTGDRLEEVTKPSYIVTEEGEIIGEYKGQCWYLDELLNIDVTNMGCYEYSQQHFITKEQAEAYVKREKARRELRVLYYENGYEENKGCYEVFFNGCLIWGEEKSNTSIPHCEKEFQEEILELPRVQELYKIIFGVDE